MKSKMVSLFLIACACASCGKKETKNEGQSYNQASVEEGPKFNPSNIKSYKGQILEVFKTANPYTLSDEVSLLIRTDKGEIPVILGPSSFVLTGSVNLGPEQAIEVKGSEIYVDGRIYIIAQEIKLNGNVLKLRDEKGNPLWTGWKKG